VERLTVELPERRYPIFIGAGLLGTRASFEAHTGERDALLVSNVIVAPLYAGTVRAALCARRVVEAILPEGEQHKSLTTIARIIDVLVANRYARDCVIVALGGGVVGDMAGFAAATYQRGVDFLQVPTTLLAQVDSSVGGKTGVNHPGGKNLIGAFHQPVAVVSDTDTLRTLPDRELSAGLAEVIKSALIRDAAFFVWLEKHMDSLLARDTEVLSYAIKRSCEIKAAIVASDEREQGERALLNLGHTFGHAIESATHYQSWLHGEAVGAGLSIAGTLSRGLGLLDAAELERLNRLLERARLPRRAPEVTRTQALDLMRIDKKVKAGRIRLVLLRRIGEAFVTAEYPDDALDRTLAAHFAA